MSREAGLAENEMLPISYCANVHAGRTFAGATENLRRYAGELARHLPRTLAVGLWFSREALAEIPHQPDRWRELRQWLSDTGISVYTMNTFPFGDFHAERVKEKVYLPDWTTEARRDYTCQSADLLAELLPKGGEGSLSTLPCALAKHHPFDKDTSIYRDRLVETARHLHRLHADTGRLIRLAIEPEPGCVLETTPQAIDFFKNLWSGTDGTPDESTIRNHVGLCYDVCHQAVEYEDSAASIRRLDAEGVRIVKMHMSCAIELADPSDEDARRQLARFVEPRYMHQTFGMHPSGRCLKTLDLTEELANNPSGEWLDCRSWRIHFHVPIHRESIGKLQTTRPALIDAVQAAKNLSYTPHWEVETYTWNIMLEQSGMDTNELVVGLEAELNSAAEMLGDS